MKKHNIIIVAVAVSILIHLGFFTYSRHIWIRGIEIIVEHAQKMFDIKLVEKKAPVLQQQILRSARDMEVLRFERATAETQTLFKDHTIEQKPKKEAGALSDTLDEEKALTRVTVPLDKAIDYTEKSLELKEKKRVAREDIFEDYILKREPSGLPRSEELESVPEEFVKEMPAFTPLAADDRTIKELSETVGYKALQESHSAQPEGKYQVLDQLLVADVSTYQDPADGKKYFKIMIIPGKDIGKLKVIPKEMVFLVDCSLSIQKERMRGFKEGLSYCLNNMGRRDIFNVISFKEYINAFRPKSIRPSPRAIKQVDKFIEDLKPTESTDLYKAFAEVIKSSPGIKPSYIMLLSDGKPTQGAIDSREIIAAINRTNNKVRAIFSFSGGARVNRYLLDFVAYRNRGWSEYADRTEHVAGGLRAIYNKIKDPILTDLRYRFSGVPADEIYPKDLPDFYKGSVFTLMGTYNEEDRFSMQLLGGAFGETKELIFSGSLSQARRGDKAIARQWAFNKIYHLIGLLAESPDRGVVIQEIRELCRRYNITTPYSENLR